MFSQMLTILTYIIVSIYVHSIYSIFAASYVICNLKQLFYLFLVISYGVYLHVTILC